MRGKAQQGQQAITSNTETADAFQCVRVCVHGCGHVAIGVCDLTMLPKGYS